jgi:hypothetical protein
VSGFLANSTKRVPGVARDHLLAFAAATGHGPLIRPISGGAAA